MSESPSVMDERPLAKDLIALTKPRIISLLLVTTLAPMYVAGVPTLATVVIVMLGGYLMAGGANAVNMYLDRDIDDVMARTKLRPIPSGRMHATAVLAFGVGIATAATWMLASFVNVLTAALALAGFYFYVFVYTRWLKRTSPQNIVIGGAAGAFPPLVGWAAVTGSLDLTAWVLFLIVFYWTPPHFWALALNKQKDYGNAGVPMAPLVGRRRDHCADVVVHGAAGGPDGAPGDVWGVRAYLFGVCSWTRRAVALGRVARACGRAGSAGEAIVVGVWVFAVVSRAVVCRDGGGSAVGALTASTQLNDHKLALILRRRHHET